MQRRGLVDEIRAARANHEASKLAFQCAKDAFAAAKRTFDATKDEHKRAQENFKRAKEAFDQVSKAFKARLEVVRSQSKKRQDDKKSIAKKAGVPYQYQDNVWVSKDRDGNTNIYFGGVGEPNGPGHGHYVMDSSGRVTYKRDPSDPHGAENFERDPLIEKKMATLAMEYAARATKGKREVQYHDGSVTVKVRSGYSRKYMVVTTDVIIIDRVDSPDEHYHLVLNSQDGSEIFAEWRKNP